MSTMIRKAVGVAWVASVMLPMSAAMGATLYGGGDTFSAAPFVGYDYVFWSPARRLSSTSGIVGAGASIDSTSIFGTYATANVHEMSYCQTGSGFGKNVLTGAGAPASSCNDFSMNPTGFSAPRVDFIDTTAAANTVNYINFNSNRPTSTAIVQFPALAGAIVLTYQVAGFSGTLNLSVAQVCGIFSGAITNWREVDLPARPIRIVYRSDNSGATFAFTTFLAANCNVAMGGPTGTRPGGTAFFQANENYAAATGFLPPASSIPANGNYNVVRTVLNPVNDGAIGYSGAGDVFAQPSSRWAFVAGFDPLAFSFPVLPNTDLLAGQVVNPGDPVTGMPVLAAAPTAASNLVSLLAIRPNLQLFATYPIYAVTYLSATKTGNGSANAPALRCLGHFIYNHTGTAGCTLGRPSVLPPGYSYINDLNPAMRLRLNTAINSIQP